MKCQNPYYVHTMLMLHPTVLHEWLIKYDVMWYQTRTLFVSDVTMFMLKTHHWDSTCNTQEIPQESFALSNKVAFQITQIM